MVHKLKDSTVSLIESLPSHEMLIPWPFKQRQLWIRFDRDVMIPSGLPISSRHKFHCLRRTSASHLYAANEGNLYETMAHLGHARAQTTLGYLDPKITASKKAAAKLLEI